MRIMNEKIIQSIQGVLHVFQWRRSFSEEVAIGVISVELGMLLPGEDDEEPDEHDEEPDEHDEVMPAPIDDADDMDFQ